ncbi:MAG: Hpt domain-containing protein [Calditrichaeota bacterium]|nr:Hpt domain-containing protein [Calditrichota bacterium]
METPRIDPEKIEELRMLVDEDDPDFLIELLEEYMNNAEVSLEAIRYAIQGKDTVTVVTIAHTLKGASSSIGAVIMAELSKQLEFLGRQDTLNGAVELIGQLEQEFVEVKHDLKKEI